MVDTQIETWQENTNNELNQLKEEMVTRIIEEMQKKDTSINFVWKKSIRKYLLDNKKTVKNFLTWIGINIFSSSSKELKELKEKIKNINTKEELINLEKSIIDYINESHNNQKTSWSESSTSDKTTTSNQTTEKENSQSSESSKKSIEPVVNSAKVWELAKVPESKEARMKRLFPSWTPKSKEEMKKYLTKIEMPIRTSDWKEGTLKLDVHTKLSEEIKAIFKEMYDKNIPVNPKKTWAFCRRKVRRWSKMSQHSYWSAIDVNYDVNGWVYGKTDKSSPYFNGKETVAIWKKHGFFRWWDWSAKSDDPMHFWFYNG